MLPVEAVLLHARGGPRLPISVDVALTVLAVGALVTGVVAYVFYRDHWERLATDGDAP